MTNPGPKSKSDRQKERLKAALRENLRRRKVQERARDAATTPEAADSQGPNPGPESSR